MRPDKEWDLKWSKTDSSESHTHFSLFPLTQLRVSQANKIPLPLFQIAQAKGSGVILTYSTMTWVTVSKSADDLQLPKTFQSSSESPLPLFHCPGQWSDFHFCYYSYYVSLTLQICQVLENAEPRTVRGLSANYPRTVFDKCWNVFHHTLGHSKMAFSTIPSHFLKIFSVTPDCPRTIFGKFKMCFKVFQNTQNWLSALSQATFWNIFSKSRIFRG